MRLENKVALVTGGGSGIGEAAAVLFAREGAKVAVLGRTAEKLEETVKRIEEAGGQGARRRGGRRALRGHGAGGGRGGGEVGASRRGLRQRGDQRRLGARSRS